MDDSQQSRPSVDAAATRKRRSSILKNQRPPRAPLSEVEFNTTTPTDTAKSRRVSFSKRTGVAEFVTNEATTTWKNFYEEHNRTLESSGNDSEMKPSPSVGHISKKIFDQQFQEVEAIDFATFDDRKSAHINISMNNVKICEQLASLECTAEDRKLAEPQQRHELSTFTDYHSKLFSDELLVSGMCELTDRIGVNFSELQPVGVTSENDDLDEIQRDLQRAQSAHLEPGVCQGPLRHGRDFSEYIEVELNMTHATLGNEQSDMSITDTIHSPKVQDVSKSNGSTDKKSNLSNKDWVTDKENIIMNPYVAPKESENFAVVDKPDEVLVFDGKRLTIQSEINPVPTVGNYRKTLLPDMTSERTPQRKTLHLNMDDDLPNFIKASTSICHDSTRKFSINPNQTVLEGDLSMTKPLTGKLIKQNTDKRRTIVFESDSGNVSMTQTLLTNIILSDRVNGNEKTILNESMASNVCLANSCDVLRKTIVDETELGDLSVTQAVPCNIFVGEKAELPEKEKTTIYYDGEDGNVSMTRAVSSNIMPEKRNTILYESNAGDISVTQAIPSNLILPDKSNILGRKKSVNEDTCNISITDALPTNVIWPEKRKMIVYDSDLGDISISQAVPSYILLPENSKLPEKRKTVYDNDIARISMSQAVPTNITLPERDEAVDKRQTVVYDCDSADIYMNETMSSNINFARESEVLPDKRRTIVYESDAGDISVTQAIPANIILPRTFEVVRDEGRRTTDFENDTCNSSMAQAIHANIIMPCQSEVMRDKRRTIVYESDTGDISITQGIPANIILPRTSEFVPDERTVDFENGTVNSSMTQPVLANITMPRKSEVVPGKSRNIFNKSDSGEICMTQAIPANIMLPNKSKVVPDKRRTIVFENETANISVTEAIPNIILPHESELVPDKRSFIVFENNTTNISMTQALPGNIILPRASEVVSDKRKTIVFENETANISMTEAIPNIILPRESELVPDKQSFIVFENNRTNISMTQALPGKIIFPRTSEVVPDKKRTIVYDTTTEDISMTQDIPGHIILAPNHEVAPDKRRSIVYERSISCIGDISTQAIHHNKMSPRISETRPDKRKTAVYETDTTDICMIQAKPLKTVLPDSTWIRHKLKAVISEHNNENDSDMPTASSSASFPFSQNQTSNDADISGSQESGKCSLGGSDGIKSKTLQISKQNAIVPQTKPRNATLSAVLNHKEMSATTDIPEKLHNFHNLTEKIPNASKSEYPQTARHVQQDVIVYQTTTGENISKLCSLERTQHDTSSKKGEPITTSYHQILESKEVSKSCEDEECNLEVFSSDESNISKTKRSLLKNLLDMSNASIEDGTDDKNLMIRMESVNSSKIASSNIDTDTSGTSLFVVTKETEEQTQTDKLVKAGIDEAKESQTLQPTSVTSKSSHPYDFKKEDDEQVEERSSPKTDAQLSNIEKYEKTNSTLLEEYLKTVNIQNTGLTTNRHFETVKESNNSPVLNRHFEKVVSPDSQNNENVKYYQSNTKPCERAPKSNKSVRDPDNTKDLLEILTDLTDKEDLDGSVQFDVKDKTELFGSLGVTLAQKQQSIVLSRESLLNSMSMAKSVLHKTQMDDSDTTEDTTINSPTRSILSKKSVRMSNEVVKKLQFEEDDSFNELQNRSTSNVTPLKKTAFGDKAYIKESKAYVIPRYLEDVSDDIKQLMDDLVKPMPDEKPFISSGLENEVRKTSSTCSTHVQANLYASSQIDVTSEDNFHMTKTPRQFSKLSVPPAVEHSVPGEVLLFDHYNPLNNVLLTPVNLSDAHSYDPFRPSKDIKNTTIPIAHRINDSDMLSKTHEKSSQGETTNFQVHYATHYRPQLYSDRSASGTTSDVHSLSSRQPIPRDQSLTMELKDYGVNTVIAMKANKELLEQSSSLTLVDDAILTGTFNSDMEIKSLKNLPSRSLKTGGKVHYNVDSHSASITEDSNLETSSTDTLEQAQSTKIKKRSLSPVNQLGHSTQPSPEVTPKPASKIQKKLFTTNIKEMTFKQESGIESKAISFSSQNNHRNQIINKPRKLQSAKRVIKNSPTSKTPDMITPVKKVVKDHHHYIGSLPQEVLTDDKLLTINILPIITTSSVKKVIKVRHVDTPPDDTALSKTILEALGSDRSDICVSGVESSVSGGGGTRGSFAHTKTSPMDWQLELAHDSSSKDLATECDSSVNVVAKIDMLPFMGSRDCEWDTPGGDSWAFRLLHGRLRLCVRLAHRLDNAARTIVRADTPVLAVTLDETHQDESNPVGVVCVQFAADTMRHVTARRCARAGDVPALLRLCAGVARVALRWGRAMQDARMHLAYTLDNNGALSLKVANIPLRSVWEVTMRLQLVADDAHETPWPRARQVRVAGIVAGAPVSDAEVQRELAHVRCDWGHAPRTVWQIFRYLKNLTRDVETNV